MIVWLKRLSQICHVPDGVLVRLAKHGDREAYGKLYIRYIDRIYRYMYFHVGRNQQEAEDLTQEVFIKAWDNFSTFDGKNFSSWLYRIAHNAIIDRRRTHKFTEALTDAVPDSTDGNEELERIATNQMLQMAFSQLTQDQRSVILLRFVEGYTTQDVARMLAKSTDAVRAIQSRGLKVMRTYLNSL